LSTTAVYTHALWPTTAGTMGDSRRTLRRQPTPSYGFDLTSH